MIDLDGFKGKIEVFWVEAIRKFSYFQHDAQVTCVALYCCPYAGWLTINFDTEKDSDNCPDFTFSAFDILQLEEWQQEYENFPILNIKINGEVKQFETEKDGDEVFNEIVFNYLKKLLQDPNLISTTDELNKGVHFEWVYRC